VSQDDASVSQDQPTEQLSQEAPPAAPELSGPLSPTWAQSRPARPPAPKRSGTDGFATAALVLGALPLLAGLLGIVFGIVALVRIQQHGGRGRKRAIIGLVCGTLWMIVFAFFVWRALTTTA
jgi:hypothetical protein